MVLVPVAAWGRRHDDDFVAEEGDLLGEAGNVDLEATDHGQEGRRVEEDLHGDSSSR